MFLVVFTFGIVCGFAWFTVSAPVADRSAYCLTNPSGTVIEFDRGRLICD